MQFSCDTAAAWRSTDGSSCYVFGKNSDRHVGEAQFVESYGDEDPPMKIRMTHSSIDVAAELFHSSVPRVARHIISRPDWMWGAEMAFNEHGVTIGNEAVFCGPNIPNDNGNNKNKKKSGTQDEEDSRLITGMDALRLAVMFSTSADSACRILSTLVEKRGGFNGPCSADGGMVYHNAFLVLDSTTALRFYALGPHWCVLEGECARAASWSVASVSNCVSNKITGQQLRAHSDGFLEFAGWGGKEKKKDSPLRDNIVNFSSTPLWFLLCDFFANGNNRECSTEGALIASLRDTMVYDDHDDDDDLLLVKKMVSAMRQHGDSCCSKPEQQQQLVETELNSLSQVSVCMHSGVGPVRENQTAQTLVVLVRKSSTGGIVDIHAFATHSPNPCIAPLTPITFSPRPPLPPASSPSSSSLDAITFHSRIVTHSRWDLISQLVRLCIITSCNEQEAAKKMQHCGTTLRAVEEKLLKEYFFSSGDKTHLHDAFNNNEATLGLVTRANSAAWEALWELRGELLLESKKSDKTPGGGSLTFKLFQWMMRREQKQLMA